MPCAKVAQNTIQNDVTNDNTSNVKSGALPSSCYSTSVFYECFICEASLASEPGGKQNDRETISKCSLFTHSFV